MNVYTEKEVLSDALSAQKATTELFNKAHEATKKTLFAYPGADYRITFAAALKNAYQDETFSAFEIWNNYTDAEKVKALRGMTGYEYNIRDARSMVINGKIIPLTNVFSWVTDAARDLDIVANEACIYVLQFFDTRPEWTLERILSRAVHQAAKFLNDNERRNPRALKRDKDGNDYIDIDAEPIAEPIAENPEKAAIFNDLLNRAARDDMDAYIIKAKAAGLATRDIAERLNVSHTAIVKRINKLYERFTAERDA